MNSLIFKRPVVFMLVLFLLSFLMHLHVFKMDLVGYHAWRQTQTQNNILNFYEKDFNILNPRINDITIEDGVQRLEFPIMQWIFACFYKLLGDQLIISRILSFLIGLLSATGMYVLLKNIFHTPTIGLIGAWAFTFSPIFYYYTMNPLPDNFALCCSIWGLALFFSWTSSRSWMTIMGVGLLFSLGVLSKLPFILFLSVPAAYLILERKTGLSNLLQLCIVFLFLTAPAIWYSHAIATHWSPVLFGIFDGPALPLDVAIDILRHNLVSTLPELLINYASTLFFVAGFYFIYKRKDYKKKYFTLFMIWGICTILYFIFEMKIIAKVHDYYLFPFLPLIFILVSYGCFHLLNSSNRFLSKFSLFLLFILPITAFIRADTRWNTKKPGFNVDLLNYKNELRSAVPDSALCIAGNDDSKNIFYYYVHKRGWVFYENDLDSIKIGSMINNGAQYLYSDSREVEEKNEIKNFLNSLILQKGSIRVYKLKREKSY